MSCVALLALPVAAASAYAAPQERAVAIGQTAAVGGPRVRPVAVVEDSRCPIGKTCVWAGRVVIRVAVELGSGTREMTLTLGKPQLVADGTLMLTSVTPPRRTRPIRPGAYRFTFRFEGGL